MHGRPSSAPVEEAVGVVLHEGRLRADAAATQDKIWNGAELFRGFFDTLKEFGLLLHETVPAI